MIGAYVFRLRRPAATQAVVSERTPTPNQNTRAGTSRRLGGAGDNGREAATRTTVGGVGSVGACSTSDSTRRRSGGPGKGRVTTAGLAARCLAARPRAFLATRAWPTARRAPVIVGDFGAAVARARTWT